ncbi:MAG: energy-coupled thiamine transporter ThiT [Negativicutes bacterium]
MNNTVGVILLAALVLLMLAIAGRQKLTARTLTLTGLCAALCIVLDLLAIYRLPQGGSITLGKMVPLFVLANVCGWRVGLLGGAIVAMLDFLVSPFIVHPIQFILDYPLAYMCLAVAGCFPRNRIIGGYCAVFLRFICHFVSGMIFFAAYAPAGVPAWQYSLSVNGIWLAIEGSIAVFIYRLLPLDVLKK